MSFKLTDLPFFAELEKELDHLDLESFEPFSAGDYVPDDHETAVATLSLPLYRLFVYSYLVETTALTQLERLNSRPETEATEENIEDCEALLQKSSIIAHLFWSCFQVEFPHSDPDDNFAITSNRWLYRRKVSAEAFIPMTDERGFGTRLARQRERS